MASPGPSSSALPSGPSRGSRQQQTLQRYNGQSLQDIQAELREDVLDNYDTAAAQQRLQAVEATRATATDKDINQFGLSLNVPAQDQYPTRLLPSPAKRKRYSLDDVTFQLSKVRMYKIGTANISVIPPDDEDGDGSMADCAWTNHLEKLGALPWDLQASLRRTISTRKASQRKVSDQIVRSLSASVAEQLPSKPKTFDLISAIGSIIEILVHVGKYLRPRDIVNLYSVSRVYHATLDTHVRSSVGVWAETMCPESAAIFPHNFYVGASLFDPMGRPTDSAYYDVYGRLTTLPAPIPDPPYKNAFRSPTRVVPSLLWLQMVYARSVRVRDILACLARQGHRMPAGSNFTLLKLWLIMELPTNRDRCTIIRTKKYFTRFDLYRATTFLIKLLLRFNDPLYGPDHGVLMELMLGQRGLTPLWKLLRGKAYTTLKEVVQTKLRYDVRPTAAEREEGLPVLGVPIDEMASVHLEGWGRGREHLLRPDELIARECARRSLELDGYFESMAVYGHIDIAKVEDLTPDPEELYMSDEDLPDQLPSDECDPHDVLVWRGAGNVPFQDGEWTPKLTKKDKWDMLSEEERQAILADDRDEILRSLVWEEETKLAFDSDGSSEPGELRTVVGEVKQEMEKAEEGLFDDDSVLGRASDGGKSDDDVLSDDDDLDFGRPSRVCSSTVPKLQSRNCSSINSMPVMTPPPFEDSPGMVGIHGSQSLLDVDAMELDDDHMASTIIASSMMGGPAGCTPHQHDDDNDPEEEELTAEERKQLEDERDEELLAQADQEYTDEEVEYNWDEWLQGYELAAKANEDDMDEADLRDYRPQY